MLPNQYLLSALHSLLGPYLTRLRSQQVKVTDNEAEEDTCAMDRRV